MDKIEFYSKFIKQQTLNEMAGPGKRGPKTKAQKEAEASAAAAKAEADKKFESEYQERMNTYHSTYAPAHRKDFEEKAHNHLTSKGFDRVLETPKASIYTKVSPEEHLVHMVKLEKPHVSVQGYVSDSHRLSYSNSNGEGSMNTPTYKPNSVMDHHREENQKHEAVHGIDHLIDRDRSRDH